MIAFHTAPPSLEAEAFRAFVALNNMGVAMMERGCYEQAHETFKNALVIGKFCRPQDECEAYSPSATVAAYSLIWQKLQEANAYAARPEAVEPSYRIAAHVVSLDAALYNMIAVAGQQPPGSFSSLHTLGYPLVRIEASPDSCADDSPDDEMVVGLNSSILLYNFAVAALYRAKTSCTESAEFEDLAVRLFCLSFSTLSNLRQSMEESGIADSFGMLRVIALSLVVLQALYIRLYWQQRLEEAEQCRTQHVWLRKQLGQFIPAEVDLLIQGVTMNAPAA